MRVKADLHVHTHVSDGSFSVQETLAMAKACGLTHVSIVDHDTVAGLTEAAECGRETGVCVIPGVEISARHRASNKRVHILGYAFDPEAKHIQALCAPLLSRRTANSLWQAQQLEAAGYPLSPAEVREKSAASTAVYKQHIMQVLVDKGVTDRVYSDLYYRHFKNGGMCDREIEYVDVSLAITAIKRDGGLAVLAHPGQPDTFDLLDDLVSAGLDGIEINHPAHSLTHINLARAAQNRYGLFLTGGSDFHGSYGELPVALGQFVSINELPAKRLNSAGVFWRP